MSAPAVIAPTVIAEAGVNHNGSLERALDMVDAAAEAGADMVKFQAFRADELASADAETAAYQAENSGQRAQLAMLRELELDAEAFESLATRCRERSVAFLCTAFDGGLLETLVALGMGTIKVPSGELTNAPLLERVAGFGLPVLLSTGMATLDEVEDAVAVLRRGGAEDVTVLHCTSLYPAPMASVNLRAMTTMAERLDLPVGYSDHTLGDAVAIAATALGARVIEKHFTLDRGLPGPDHKASLEPGELATMIRRIRDVAVALGDGVKRPADDEADTARVVRRSWHAARDLAAGATVANGDATLKRPASGLAPAESPIGRKLAHAVKADAPIRAEDLTP